MEYKDVVTVLLTLWAVLFVVTIAMLGIYGVNIITAGGFCLINALMIGLCIMAEDSKRFAFADPELEAFGRQIFDLMPALITLFHKESDRTWRLEVANEYTCRIGNDPTSKWYRPATLKRTARVFTYNGDYGLVKRLRQDFNMMLVRAKPRSDAVYLDYIGLMPGEVPFSVNGITDDPHCRIEHHTRELSDEEFEAECEMVRRDPADYVSREKTWTTIHCE